MVANVAIAVFLVINWIAALLFFWYRRKLPVYAEWKNAKSRLPIWVRVSELLILLSCWAVLFLALSIGQYVLHRAIHHARPSEDGMVLLMLVVACVGAYIPAGLITNAVSWLLPPLRKANQSAFGGLPTVSYRLATRELLQVGLWPSIFCTIFAFIAVGRS